MSRTPRLGLGLLWQGQAQKELFHNESLHVLDALVSAAVEEGPRASPPEAPVPGCCYLVATEPTGAWSGRSQCVAAFTSGGWRFIAPVEGMTVHVRTTGSIATYRSGDWELGVLRGSSLILNGQQIVGPRAAGIASPAGGATVDVQARSAIDQILSAMHQHGLIET
jgi:Protein of unknown function (DUF2793)